MRNLSQGARSELRKRRIALAAALKSAGSEEAESVSDDLADAGIESLSENELKTLSSGKGARISSNLCQFASISRSAAIIATAAEKASNFLKALKDYSYQEKTGKPKRIDLAKQIETILTLYYSKIKQGIRVTRDFRIEGLVLCFPEKLEQVWINLVNNALYSMNCAGELLIEARMEGKEVLVSFTDSGPGIPDEAKAKLFMPFFTTKPRGEGSGIGLGLCKKIVELHKGSIWFQSMPGKTTFTVRLPLNGIVEERTAE